MGSDAPQNIRRRLMVRGIVQGVGFRPFVYGLAQRLGLGGFVLNDSDGVTLEIEGSADALDAFEQTLRTTPPPLARIDAISVEAVAPCGETIFRIETSRAAAVRNTLISPDVATCDDCLRELFDPADRRFGYPFINCTNCGPRFTIVLDVPYDRAQTTMHVFPMCPACQAEYDDPLNRRFHAQPNACAACGPSLAFHWRSTAFRPSLSTDASPIEQAAAALAQGAILAIKGLGGYHLACDALDHAAVARLRTRKQREAKPFALMAPDLETIRQLCYVNKDEEALLMSRQRPIVLLDALPDAPVAPSVAPGYATLGIMLPYTPLHHLLLRAYAAAASGRLPVLVMTSGNLSDEPIAYRDDDAAMRLASIADGMLTHNRDIHMRCDDSVARIVAGGVQLLRRSRGYAPEPVTLALRFPKPLLAVGGHLKNTFCLAKGHDAFLSHHIGDLENLETLTSFREGVRHFARLFDCHPEVVAYDLHPEYLATKEALASDIPLKIGVQHHHAHIASVLAEHGIEGPVIGVAADGTGYGLDGAIWGCEVLIADLRNFVRFAHLAYIPLPGGDAAVRQVWRIGATYLWRAFGDAFLDLNIPFVQRINRQRWALIARMIERGVNAPPTSSLGRLFDAVAAIVGIRDHALYEGQAAIELETAAGSDDRPYPFALLEGAPLRIDPLPTIRAIVADLQTGAPVAQVSGRFHGTVAEALAQTCERARATGAPATVALSGGVFQNRRLTERLVARLEQSGFRVLLNRRVPPNDGGLCLGQAAVAAARLDNLRS
ncbi:MAG: carbamoyltransferase HypF [Roseiflexus sp.]|nr:carbamoyltransferase HypF [Roseiflexus sp.]MCS7288047.1 carbamoyltransferase HypF [Roseiflexus sp.]MDW8147998.1 carbamoyltransferase HypF [Roseiflexaceae bacterium]MDW8233738.1 carbamoyltransferase HypF [Roseiflexaceae bacterium]